MTLTGQSFTIPYLIIKTVQKPLSKATAFLLYRMLKIGIDIFKTMSYNIYIILVANYHFTTRKY